MFDLVSSVLLLAVIWPVFLIIAILIKRDSPGSVFYFHERVGHNGKRIKLLKFRTMYSNSDEIFNSLPQETKDEFFKIYKLDPDPRITKVGRFLRRTSIDELPQLLNIIRGDLSVIGPRPLVSKELSEKYGSLADELLSVKPGLTGYWAAYERSNCSYEKRMQMELYYAKNPGFALDCRILARSVKIVVSGRGAA